jgi:lysophospholipase L1-like esterase
VASGQTLHDTTVQPTPTPSPEAAAALPLQLRNKTVLLVGDSMAGGLGPFLQKKVEEAGGRFVNVQEQSSTIIWWHGSGRLREALMRHQPDVVFISLGSNELFTKSPDTRAPIIKKIVEEIGARPAYWIGPPSWKPDRGLVRVIEENFQAGRFYNSNHLDVPRAQDKKHPTQEGYERWVELIWNWYAQTM